MREPFKDFFDYEFWLQGSEYAGKGDQYGKFFVIECFYDAGVPRHLFYITKENPIRGTDSAQIKLDGSKGDMTCYAWRGLRDSPDPERLVHPEYLNPAYLRIRFRIDEWVTDDEDWRITLAALAGAEYGGSWAEGQVIVGLEGLAPPKLRLHYRIGNSFDWWTDELTQKVLSTQQVSLGVVHTLEIMRFGDAVNGRVAVWLDGILVPDLNFEDLDTSYPGGVTTVMLGSHDAVDCGFFSEGYSEDSKCTITFDDFRIRDEYIGPSLLPIPTYQLTLDATQQKEIRIGNHVFPAVPQTIQVPEGTVPKVGVDPTDFDHWEITPEVPDHPFSSYKELWPDISPALMANVTRTKIDTASIVPTPAIYADSMITAVYLAAVKRQLSVASSPIDDFPVFVDGVEVGVTPFTGLVYEGERRIGAYDEVEK